MSGNKAIHDEIIFRVLLAREEARPKLSFDTLEKSLPRSLRKIIESDWRAFIRDEGLEFDAAFQKAVRKHLPGIYFLLIATEFIHGVLFHEALAHFLNTSVGNTARSFGTDEVFALAEEMSSEMNRRVAEALKQQQTKADGKLTPPLKFPGDSKKSKPNATPQQALPSPTPKFLRPEARPDLGSVKKPIKPQRPGKFGTIPLSKLALSPSPREEPTSDDIRCGFCRKKFPRGEIGTHIENVHLTPRVTQPTKSVDFLSVKQPESPQQNFKYASTGSASVRFKHGKCIGCGNLPIPGDFYCYYCAPK